jgi:hypothetical protein
MSDAINKPAHYNQGLIECIEAMKIVLTPEEFRGYLKGNVFKYLWREKDKNGNEDIRKGKSYYDWLIELIDESEQQKAADLQSLKDYPFGKLKTAHLNSDTIPEGYRKLNDSSEEPRQLGDLRWSVAEKRYVEISVDEIGYANRDNWAACRKVEPTVKQSLTLQPPDGWRWLERGELIRNGDKPVNGVAIPLFWIGTPCCNNQFILRRNKFEVGEKVVHGDCKSLSISVVGNILSDGWVDLVRDGVSTAYHVKDLAPYIEEAK